MSKSIRLLIADSDIDFADRLRAMLHEQTDIKVVEIVRDGQGAVNGCKLILPDLILMDLRLPMLDSVRAIQSIAAENKRIKVLVTSAMANDPYAVEAIKVGASGYIEKNGDNNNEAIIEALQQVAAGEALMNPALASSILEEFHRLTD